MQLDFSQTLDYLQGLGRRHQGIGRAALGFEGKGEYPVLLVEPDPLCAESSPGLMNYDFAVLVLDREQDASGAYRADPDQVPALLTQTGQWCDEFIEQLRAENPGDLMKGTYSRVALAQCAGGDLATGWRAEFRLQVVQNINRNTNGALFEAGSDTYGTLYRTKY